MNKRRVLTPGAPIRLAATLLLLLLLTVGLQTPAPPPAVAQGPGEVLLYSESFGYADYSEVPGWRLGSEFKGEVGWAVEGGRLRGKRHYWATYEKDNWYDTHLELTVFLHDGFEGLNVSVRQSQAGRYGLALHPDRVVFFKQQGLGAGEGVKNIGEDRRRFAEGKPHGVSISVYTGRVLVVIDGVTEFDWVDPDPLPAGGIAFETLDKSWAEVDDVRVYGPAPVGGPDLSIVAADKWEFSADLQTLVLYIMVANEGDVPSGEAQVRASDPQTGWDSALFPVASLAAGSNTTLAIELKIPEDRRGLEQAFRVQVDPGDRLTNESNASNNEMWTPAIRIPRLPELQVPYLKAVDPDRGRAGEEITVRIFGDNLSPESGVFIPDLVDVQYVKFVSPGELEARIVIQPEAPAGPRPVSVGVQGGPRAVLEGGFTVLEPQRAAQPDLSASVSGWYIDEDRFLVLRLVVRNAGDGLAGETMVRAEEPGTGWSSDDRPVPGLKAGDEVPIEIRMEIPDEQRGKTHRFNVTVDPNDRIDEKNENDNIARTGDIPVRPARQVETPFVRPPSGPTTGSREGGGLNPAVLALILVGGLMVGGAYWLLRRGQGGRRGPEEKRRVVAGGPATYYYASGVRVPVSRRDDLIAIKFRGGDSAAAAARAGVGIDVPGFRPPVAADLWPGGEVLLRRRPGEARSPQQQEVLLRTLSQRAGVEHASFVYEPLPDHLWIATDRFVAQFPAGMSPPEIAALNRQYGVEIVETIAWLPRTYLLRVTPASPGDALSTANTYVEGQHAAWAHPDFLRQYVHRTPVLRPDGAAPQCYWHLSAIKAFEAWQVSSGGPQVVVAIIDDGADVDHAAFPNQAEHLDVLKGSGDPRPPVQNSKEYWHGTACAGLAVGAANQGVGTSGVAPGCRLMAVRLLEPIIPVTMEHKLVRQLTEAEREPLRSALSAAGSHHEAAALQWASEHGADVISISWGRRPGYAQSGKTVPIDDLTRLTLGVVVEHGRGGKGCVICWAAGNDNESISFDGYASRPEVLAVGACTADDKRAPYSDFGPELALTAPGGGYTEGLLTTVDVDLQAHRAYRHDFNGTSAAAPIVAGLAALVLSVNPDLTREQVYGILRDTADKIDPQGGQYDSRGHSPFYGWGRVNAQRALQRAAQLRP